MPVVVMPLPRGHGDTFERVVGEDVANTLEAMRNAVSADSESLELVYRPTGETIEHPDRASQTEATTPLASMEGVSWCGESDAWNCKYCRKAAGCEERRTANRELWSQVRDFREVEARIDHMTWVGDLPKPGVQGLLRMPEELNPAQVAQVAHARREAFRAVHKTALDRLSDLQWAGSLGSMSFVGYPFVLEQAPITLDHVAIVDQPAERGRRARYGWRANQSA